MPPLIPPGLRPPPPDDPEDESTAALAEVLLAADVARVRDAVLARLRALQAERERPAQP